MLKYVVEEVDRVKAMYEDRLARTAADREAAQIAEKQALERLSAAELRVDEAMAESQAGAKALAELEKRLISLPQQLEVPIYLAHPGYRWQ